MLCTDFAWSCGMKCSDSLCHAPLMPGSCRWSFYLLCFSIQSEILDLAATILFLTTFFLFPTLGRKWGYFISYFLKCPCCCAAAVVLPPCCFCAPASGTSVSTGARRHTFLTSCRLQSPLSINVAKWADGSCYLVWLGNRVLFAGKSSFLLDT